MESFMRTGVVDEPIKESGSDNLGLTLHSQSLIQFIERSQTPITIGIQGEWGSGKTSLMNAINHHFELERRDIKQIWVNSWEYSLLSSPEEALVKIITKIIDDLLEADDNIDRKNKISSGAKEVFKGVARIGATVAFGSGGQNIVDKALETKPETISSLRDKLEDLIIDIASRDTNPFSRIVVYVDDLDRMEPKNAVAVLELLKNVFTVKNCVFLLAIDYQVVVKGLKEKFGPQTAENEWEFRAFFDKIIQLPFMMPMGQYDIGKYVNELLKSVGFISGAEFKPEEITDTVLLSIGGNPRSIKRLVNSVSLIQIFTQTKIKLAGDGNNFADEINLSENDEKLLLFTLLCLQIAYPQIYTLLTKRPNFLDWDSDFAFRETQNKEEEEKERFEKDFTNAQKTEDCDEEWEKALYRICYVNPRMRTRFKDISKFLSQIKAIMEDRDLKIGDTLELILSQTSVTSVTSTDDPIESVKPYQRTLYDGMKTWVNTLDSQGYSPTIIKTVNTIHSLLSEYSDETVFSKIGGATYYVKRAKTNAGPNSTGTVKIAQLKIRGTKTPYFDVRFLKNKLHDHRIPKIDGLSVNHIRQFHREKITNIAFSTFYSIHLKLDQANSNTYLEVLRQLASENLIFITNNFHDMYPYGVNDLKKALDEEDEETLLEMERTLSSDYTYDFNG